MLRGIFGPDPRDYFSAVAHPYRVNSVRYFDVTFFKKCPPPLYSPIFPYKPPYFSYTPPVKFTFFFFSQLVILTEKKPL